MCLETSEMQGWDLLEACRFVSGATRTLKVKTMIRTAKTGRLKTASWF